MSKQSTLDADAGGPSTLASAVFEKLRLDILEGHIPPGEKLRIDALRERYGVGASPLREALNRLAAMHLVEQVDQRGFRVPALSVEEFDELSRTRCWVNEIAVREAILHGDKAWEEGIVLAFHRLWRTPVVLEGGHINREWEVLHRRFHAALISTCPSKWLRDFHETLFDYADRHRYLHAQRTRREEDTVQEHRDIMEAVVRRDASLAVKLLNDAILSLGPPASDGGVGITAPAGGRQPAPAAVVRRGRAAQT
jgi:GntR family transcriptional regulator, carbon starvation induced regulator